MRPSRALCWVSDIEPLSAAVDVELDAGAGPGAVDVERPHAPAIGTAPPAARRSLNAARRSMLRSP